MKRAILIVLMLSVAPTGAAIAAEDAVQTARKLYRTHQDSVLFVLAVARIEATAAGKTLPAQEQKIEAIGTVIDRSGLTVISYSAINPGLALRGRKFRTSSGTVTIQAKTDFKEVKIRLSDGTEVPAKMVLTDIDLDLAFILPDADSDEAKGASFNPIRLEKPAKLDVLDEAIALGRLDKSLDRRPTVVVGRIGAIVKKPRTFYRATVGSLGGPVFAADGRIVGITVRRMVDERPSATVLLPAQDVQEIAKQALARKKPAKKEPAKD